MVTKPEILKAGLQKMLQLKTRSEGTYFEPCESAVLCYSYYRSVKTSGSENKKSR